MLRAGRCVAWGFRVRWKEIPSLRWDLRAEGLPCKGTKYLETCNFETDILGGCWMQEIPAAEQRRWQNARNFGRRACTRREELPFGGLAL